MSPSKLLPFSRWGKWVRKDKKAGCKACFLRDEHRSLTSAIGLAAQEQPAGNEFSQGSQRAAQSGAVVSATSTGRPVRTALPIWKVAAEHDKTRQGECFGE